MYLSIFILTSRLLLNGCLSVLAENIALQLLQAQFSNGNEGVTCTANFSFKNNSIYKEGQSSRDEAGTSGNNTGVLVQ